MTNWKTFDLNLLVVFDAVMQEKNLIAGRTVFGIDPIPPSATRSRACATC